MTYQTNKKLGINNSTSMYPESSIQNPESSIQNPVSRIQNPVSRIQYPESSIQNPASRTGFSLLEVLVAIVVLGVVVAAAAGTFASMQAAWRKQRNTIDLVQNARWAMERMVNEIRQGGIPITISGGNKRIRFQIDPGPPPIFVWYWRGNTGSDTTGLGDETFLYRGPGTNINTAYNNRQQLANFIVDNPNGNDIFDEADRLVSIELTLRPRPAEPNTAPENRDYTLITRVRPRN